MKIIPRYISTNIISTILITSLVLLALAIFILFAGEFPDIGTGNYNFLQVSLYVLLLLPSYICQLFPMAGLLGTLTGMGLLASRSELIVMRAAGVSLTQMTKIVLTTAFFMSVAVFLLGEVVAPYSQHLASELKARALSKGALLYTQHGIWLRSDQNYVHISQMLPNQHLLGITVYQFDNNYHLQKISYATEGEFQNNKWMFSNITESLFTPKQITSNKVPVSSWNLNFRPRLLTIINIDPNERTLPQLFVYIKYLNKMGLQTNNYGVAFWQRLLSPLSTIVMILLAIPFVFGPLRSATMGLRLVSGIVAGFVYYVIILFIGPLSALYQISPFLISIAPILLVAGIGGYFLMRMK
jgi:lipopolysaccharide export system permease protein